MRGPFDPPMQVTINWRYCGAKTEDTAIDNVAIYIRPGKLVSMYPPWLRGLSPSAGIPP